MKWNNCFARVWNFFLFWPWRSSCQTHLYVFKHADTWSGIAETAQLRRVLFCFLQRTAFGLSRRTVVQVNVPRKNNWPLIISSFVANSCSFSCLDTQSSSQDTLRDIICHTFRPHLDKMFEIHRWYCLWLQQSSVTQRWWCQIPAVYSQPGWLSWWAYLSEETTQLSVRHPHADNWKLSFISLRESRTRPDLLLNPLSRATFCFTTCPTKVVCVTLVQAARLSLGFCPGARKAQRVAFFLSLCVILVVVIVVAVFVRHLLQHSCLRGTDADKYLCLRRSNMWNAWSNLSFAVAQVWRKTHSWEDVLLWQMTEKVLQCLWTENRPNV